MCQAELRNFAPFLSYLPKNDFFNYSFRENVEWDFLKHFKDGRKKCLLSTVNI